MSALSAGTHTLTSQNLGSVVRLENTEKLELDMGLIYVNGEPFNGTRSTLKAKGVVVEGDGKIQVGPKLGLTVIFR